MNIKIAERLRPFQHVAGTACLVPGSELAVKVYPALIEVYDMSNCIAEIELEITGPVEDFTVQLDLEKGQVLVWGKSSEGFFRYSIVSYNSSIALSMHKPKDLKYNLRKGALKIYENQTYTPPSTDRLSLGNSKAQDWELVRKRCDLAEILPSWLRLGQLLPQPQVLKYSGTAALLHECGKIIREGNPNEFLSPFKKLFLAGFEGIMLPRLQDAQHQGFKLNPPDPSESSLILLTEGAKLIRSLFVKCENSDLFILPALPKEFHCGRFLNVQCSIGQIDIEWSKKQIRRMILRSEVSKPIDLHFQKGIKRYRVDGHFVDAAVPLQVETGQRYVLDRFEK